MIHYQLLTQHPNFIPLVQETVWQTWQESIMHEYKVTQETFKITPSHYYTVLDADTLVAFAAVDTCDLPSLYPNYTPWLTDLFVFPAYRHQNVATSLIHFISNQHPNLYLWCETSLASFYQARGWILLHQINYLGKPINILSKSSK